jgi:hypothetical protein
MTTYWFRWWFMGQSSPNSPALVLVELLEHDGFGDHSLFLSVLRVFGIFHYHPGSPGGKVPTTVRHYHGPSWGSDDSAQNEIRYLFRSIEP